MDEEEERGNVGHNNQLKACAMAEGLYRMRKISTYLYNDSLARGVISV